jgi:hypothetical protein
MAPPDVLEETVFNPSFEPDIHACADAIKQETSFTDLQHLLNQVGPYFSFSLSPLIDLKKHYANDGSMILL